MAARGTLGGRWREFEVLVEQIAETVFFRFGGRIDLDDLRQTGMVTLLEACERFDPRRADTFRSWATIRIRGAVFDHARREIRRTPRLRATRLLSAVTPDACDPGAGWRGSELTADELVGIGVLADGRRTTQTAWHGGRRSMESEVLYRDFIRSLRSRLAGLEPPERAAIERHDLGGAPIAEVADQLGVSRAAATRVRRRALSSLRAGW